MIPAVLTFLLLQVGAQATGAVTGVVRSSAGTAAGVRVYAQQIRDSADANSPAAPLEGQAQTDASGRYRLELPAGRYHIASGSVSTPTYYPGTTDIAQAKPVLVAAGGVVEDIDFGSFVPAILSRSQFSFGFLSGTVRYPDGNPAAGISVIGFSAGIVPAGTGGMPVSPVLYGRTDANGRYRLASVLADTYYLAAGFAEAPAFHTGGPNGSTPKTATLTPPANVDALDIEIPFPVRKVGTAIVRGRVMFTDGTPAVGTTVVIASPFSGPPEVMGIRLPINLPSAYSVSEVPVRPDGTFELSNIVPG